MDVRVDDILQMKKAHPCGENRFLVLRIGMDFKIRCLKCGHEVMAPRSKIEKSIKKILRDGEEIAPRVKTAGNDPAPQVKENGE